jgi:hypothetical protein
MRVLDYDGKVHRTGQEWIGLGKIPFDNLKGLVVQKMKDDQ